MGGRVLVGAIALALTFVPPPGAAIEVGPVFGLTNIAYKLPLADSGGARPLVCQKLGACPSPPPPEFAAASQQETSGRCDYWGVFQRLKEGDGWKYAANVECTMYMRGIHGQTCIYWNYNIVKCTTRYSGENPPWSMGEGYRHEHVGVYLCDDEVPPYVPESCRGWWHAEAQWWFELPPGWRYTNVQGACGYWQYPTGLTCKAQSRGYEVS